MFKKIFEKLDLIGMPEEPYKGKTVTVMEKPKKEVAVKKEPEEVIDSKHIQADIDRTFAKVLEEFNLSVSKESKIESLKKSLESFKDINKTIYEKIDTLKSVGLVNTPSASAKLAELKEQESKVRDNIYELNRQLRHLKEVKEYTDKYAMQYVGYKFVDHKTMVEIMKKYDLVLGEAFTYAKEIPDKSLSIIKNFSEEIEKSKEVVEFIRERRINELRGSSSTTYKKHVRAKTEEDTEEFILPQPEHSLEWMSRDYKFTISKFKMIAPSSHFVLPSIKDDEQRYWGSSRDRETKYLSFMAFNESERCYYFSTSSLNDALAKREREVLDPIAVLEVAGGYIVMDAWDEEAEIPEIQNPLNN